MTVFDASIPDVLEGERVDRAVSLLCDVSRSVAASLIADGAVRLDGGGIARPSERVRAGCRLEVELPEHQDAPSVVADPTVDVPVIHVDDALLVVDKPPGLVVHPGAGNREGTMVHGLLANYPELAGVGEAHRPGIVHRLDRDTSGLLVVARTNEAHEALSAALRRRTVTRRYRTLAWGHVREPRGTIDAPIARSPRDPTKMGVVVGGRPARTTYEVLARYDHPVAVTELSCTLETGRTHQIRVHLQGLGHPVVGDRRYAGARESFPAPRQFLHAAHLAFDHPVTGTRLQFDSELPADLVAVLARLQP